jgi:hypothetical protein
VPVDGRETSLGGSTVLEVPIYFCYLIPPSSGLLERDFDTRAGQVFIALSFQETKTPDGVQKAFEEAIKLVNDSHPNSPLAPMRIDKQGDESYEIPARVFQEIDDGAWL